MIIWVSAKVVGALGTWKYGEVPKWSSWLIIREWRYCNEEKTLSIMRSSGTATVACCSRDADVKAEKVLDVRLCTCSAWPVDLHLTWCIVNHCRCIARSECSLTESCPRPPTVSFRLTTLKWQMFPGLMQTPIIEVSKITRSWSKESLPQVIWLDHEAGDAILKWRCTESCSTCESM